MSSTSDCGCGCGGKVTLLFPCSGASNVGQITNDLALRLTREGVGAMSCLAGVGARISGFVVSAANCDQLVVLDGCALRCAKKVFEQVGIEPHVHLVLTEHGFAKRHGAVVQLEEVERARELVLGLLEGGECSAML